MTYSPAQAGLMTGDDYFTSIGLIGGSTGMAPLLVGNTTFPSPGGTYGQTPTITNSVMHIGTGSAVSYAAYNLDGGAGSTAYSKLLITYFAHPAGATAIGSVSMENAYDTSGEIDDGYWLGTEGQSGTLGYKRVSTTWSALGSHDGTCYQRNYPIIPAWGYASYVEEDIQKFFIKSSEGQWVQILGYTDDAFSSFKSMAIRVNVGGARYITPFRVWGAV